MRVLLIEDDAILGAAVRDQVAADGHGVDWAKRLDDADDRLAAETYDLILLDLMLPDGLGVEFLKRRRRTGDTTPVIILTALERVSDRIAGLNAGADDYLVKPFDLAELSARLGAVARRYAGNPNPILRIGDVAVDRAARTVTREGRSVALTAREWAIFDELLRRPSAIVDKRRLEECLYDLDSHVESNTIEVYVGRLRRKLGQDVIGTVRGMGYRLAGPVSAGNERR